LTRLIFRPLIFILILFTACGLCADVVVLKNDNTMRGVIKEADDKRVVLEQPDGRVIIPRDEIKEIRRENARKYFRDSISAHIKTGDLEEAYRQARFWLKNEPGKSARKAYLEAAAGLTTAKLEAGKIAEAEKIIAEVASLVGVEGPLAKTASVLKEKKEQREKEIKRAQVLLDVSDYREAVIVLRPLVGKNPQLSARLFPMLANAYAGLGEELLRERRIDRAIRAFELAVRYEAKILDRIRTKLLYVRLVVFAERYNRESRKWSQPQWAGALRQAEAIAELDPSNLHARFFTGVSKMALRRFPESRLDLEFVLGGPRPGLSINELGNAAAEKLKTVVIALEPPKKKTAFSGAVRDLKKVEGVHFDAFAPTEDMARKAVDCAEYFHQRIRAFFYDSPMEGAWPKKCLIYIHPGKDVYMRRTGQPEWSPGVTKTRLENGKLTSHAIHTHVEASNIFSDVLPHEMGHVFLWSFLGYPRNYPLWIHEGVAVWQEKRIHRISLLEKIYAEHRAGDLLSFSDIVRAVKYPQADKVREFYGLSYVAVDMLIATQGRKKFLDFALAVKTLDPRDAISKYYGADLAAFEKALVYRVVKLGKALEGSPGKAKKKQGAAR